VHDLTFIQLTVTRSVGIDVSELDILMIMRNKHTAN